MMSRVCPSCARSDVPCTSTLATLCPVCLAELRPGVVLAPVAVSHVPKAGDLLWVEVEEQVPELEACVQDGTCRPAAGGGSAVTWKTALVTETLPGQRFVCCVNGENDFIEEVREAWTESTSGPLHPMCSPRVYPRSPRAQYGMEDRRREWRAVSADERDDAKALNDRATAAWRDQVSGSAVSDSDSSSELSEPSDPGASSLFVCCGRRAGEGTPWECTVCHKWLHSGCVTRPRRGAMALCESCAAQAAAPTSRRVRHPKGWWSGA